MHWWVGHGSFPLFENTTYELRHGISNNMVCATSKGSDQPAHMRSLIRAFASRFRIPWLLSYWWNTIWSFLALKVSYRGLSESTHVKCHIVRNHMPRLNYILTLISCWIFPVLLHSSPLFYSINLQDFSYRHVTAFSKSGIQVWEASWSACSIHTVFKMQEISRFSMEINGSHLLISFCLSFPGVTIVFMKWVPDMLN